MSESIGGEMKKHAITAIDIEVLFRLKQGDESAFDAVYWKYNSCVFNFIYSLLYDKSLAEDLTQNVFLKIWEKRATIDPELGFDAYLFAIARNLVYKETEKRLESEQLTFTFEGRARETDSLTEENIDAESLREYIDALIEQLPLSRKQIFLLSRRQHLSNKEIADRLSVSEKTVETQIYRALRFIKQKLSEESNLAVLILVMIKGC